MCSNLIKIAIRRYILFVIICFSTTSYGQSVIDSFGGFSQGSFGDLSMMTTERINKISSSKRIFVISRVNNGFQKGDFITIVRDSKLVARALVATIKDEMAGIKILKIYSLRLWNQLRPGINVQILRGDDSYFHQKDEEQQQQQEEKEIIKVVNDKGEIEEKEVEKEIEDESDLFNDTVIMEDDFDLDDDDEERTRKIRTDNIIGVGYGYIKGKDAEGGSANYTHMMGMWGYQLVDNTWIEGMYGQSLAADYPAGGIDTTITSMTFRLKYTISAPFYSFVQPYLGYQIINADSPGAGTELDDEEEKAKELQAVEDLKKRQLVFGATILKRLVPGWFARLDLGTDILSAGLCLEF